MTSVKGKVPFSISHMEHEGYALDVHRPITDLGERLKKGWQWSHKGVVVHTNWDLNGDIAKVHQYFRDRVKEENWSPEEFKKRIDQTILTNAKASS